MTAIITTIISFFLEMMITLYIPYLSISSGILFTLISTWIGSYYFHFKKDYYIYLFCTGLFYDVITNTLLFHAVIFLILGYGFRKTYTWLSKSWYSLILVFIVFLLLYRILSYSILLFCGYLSFNMTHFFMIMISSFLPNIIYGYFLCGLLWISLHRN